MSSTAGAVLTAGSLSLAASLAWGQAVPVDKATPLGTDYSALLGKVVPLIKDAYESEVQSMPPHSISVITKARVLDDRIEGEFDYPDPKSKDSDSDIHHHWTWTAKFKDLRLPDADDMEDLSKRTGLPPERFLVVFVDPETGIMYAFLKDPKPDENEMFVAWPEVGGLIPPFVHLLKRVMRS